eukprot:gene7619-15602_t
MLSTRSLTSPVRKCALKSLTCRFSTSGLSGPEWKEKNEKSGRPISPHVTIYAFPIAATSSIANRGTGLALSAGISGIGVLALAGGDVSSIAQTIGSMAFIGQLAKFSVAFPLVYHYLASIRHFVWDRMPETLENDKVAQSSYALLGSSTAISVVLAFVQI